MSVNITTAPSVRPGVLFRALATTADVTIYAPSGYGAQITNTNLVNQTSSDVTVTLSVIKSGGLLTDGICYMFEETIRAKGTLDSGGHPIPGVNRLNLEEINLDEGDFISVKASASNAVAITGTGWEYGVTGTVLSGIRDDAVGVPGYGANVTQADGLCDVGNGPNRLLAALLLATHEAGQAGFATYDTLGMNCGSGVTSMGPPKVSVNFNQGGNLNGSAHLFALSGPAANTRHTVRGLASKAGIAMDLTVIPISLTGVASVTGFSTVGPSAAALLSLPVTTGVGHRVLWGLALDKAPQGLKATGGSDARLRGLEGSETIGFTVPHFGALVDAIGIAGALTLVTRNSLFHAGVGLDCVPA